MAVRSIALFALSNLHALKMEKKNPMDITDTSEGTLMMAEREQEVERKAG